MAGDAVDARHTGQKTAVITGGASGIGLTMVQLFAGLEYNVVILDVSEFTGLDMPEIALAPGSRFPKPKIVWKRCDVSSWQDQADKFKQVYREFGRIDVVCANAGISEQGTGAMSSIEDDEPQQPNLKIMDVNLTGVIYSTKLAIHYMKKNESDGSSRGSIICTASNAGLYAFPVSPLYAATKAGIIGFVRSTGPIVEQHDIQINALAPAVLVTNLAPDKSLFKNMTITPMSTLIDGVKKFIENPRLNGEVAEIHGNSVTLRPPHDYVDEDSKNNLETFRKLGYA